MATHKNNLKMEWRAGDGEFKKTHAPSNGTEVTDYSLIMSLILFIFVVRIATKYPNPRVYIL